MSPRKKYIIIGTVGAVGWLFGFAALFGSYQLLNYSQYGGVLSEMPSEEALKRLEAGGISTDEVASLLRDANATGISWSAITYFLEICDNVIDNGNANRTVFNSCGSFLWSTEKNLQSIFDESWAHIEMINSTQRST